MKCVFCDRTVISVKQLGIAFHRFPEGERKSVWLQACGFPEYKQIQSSDRLCSTHFTPEDFEDDWGCRIRMRLKRGSVPSIFAWKKSEYCIACVGIPEEHNLHRFPSDPLLRKNWREACNANGFTLKLVEPKYSLCTKHFVDDCFVFDPKMGKNTLKTNAIPTLFSQNVEPSIGAIASPLTTNAVVTENFETKPSPTILVVAENVEPSEQLFIKSSPTMTDVEIFESNEEDDPTETECSTQPIASNSESRVVNTKRRLDLPVSSSKPKRKRRIWRPSRAGDLTEEHFSSPEKAKINLNILSTKCKEYKQKICRLEQRNCYLQKKLQTLEKLLSYL